MTAHQNAAACLRGARVTVLGAGESGMAAARWLLVQGARVAVSDSRPVERWSQEFVRWCQESNVAVEGGGHREDTCTGCDIMVVSPGISAAAAPVQMAMDAGCAVVNDLILAASFFRGKMIAITGTNGKTTTTMLAAHLLKCSGEDAVAAGNISPPLFDVMDRDTAVLEVSSFQLELLTYGWKLPFERPEITVSVWLNLAPDHLDRHGDLETYGNCKAQLLMLQSEQGHAVINEDDQALEPWRKQGEGRRFFFRHGRSDGSRGAWISEDGSKICLQLDSAMSEHYDLSKWRLSGGHNLENLAAALSAARFAGAEPHGLRKGIESFRPPAHRFETVAVCDGIIYIDDSKATNAAAAVRALESVTAPVALIAGGLGKNEDYAPLASAVAGLRDRGMLRAVVLMGAHGREIARAIEKSAPDEIPLEFAGDEGPGEAVMKRAVELAVSHVQSGDAVLLSPACASFDMFESYSQRGDIFLRAVQEISCS